MVEFCKIVFLCVFAATVSGAPHRNSLLKNVKTLNELIRTIQKNPSIQNGVSLIQNSLKNIATTGIILGTVNTEKKMEFNILKLLSEFYKNLQSSNTNAAAINMRKLEKSMERDRQAIEILRSIIDLAMSPKGVREYRQVLDNVVKNGAVRNKNENLTKTEKINRKSIKDLQTNVNNHLIHMRDKVNKIIQEAMKTMSSKKNTEKSSTSLTIMSQRTHMNDIINRDYVQLPHYYLQLPTSPVYQIDLESVYRFRRQNGEENDEKMEKDNQLDISNENEGEDFEDALAPPSNNGGLAGLIASLSGGEGGSDVGALVGAISGVVTNLFGPGGLDIPSLLSTGTSLIAGLLGGDENFGKVLGSYIGIAVEGLSGGGGADNNGAFFGNFLGTLLSQLSADPEEEGGPQPKIFFDNFFKGFEQTKQKRGTEDSSMNHKGYFFEFLSNIISSIVGGVTNLILNASIGSSGGSSQGSADLSAGSSQGSHKGSASASQTSSMGSMHSESKPMLKIL